MRVTAEMLDREIRIERPVADDSLTGAGSGHWETVAQIAAGVQDILPSRGEAEQGGFTVSTRRARVRIRHRAGVDSTMRVLVGRAIPGGDPDWVTERTAQIVTEPAEIGRRDGLEFMIEDYTPAGNRA